MGLGSNATSRSRRWPKWTWLFLLSMVLPPLLMSTAWILPGALQVLQTGTCPPAPPDIPPHPCSLGTYLIRMTVGLWALMGQLATWLSWFVANLVLWGVGLFGVALYRNWRSD